MAKVLILSRHVKTFFVDKYLKWLFLFKRIYLCFIILIGEIYVFRIIFSIYNLFSGGWLLEVLYNLVFGDKRIVNRGFLIGPYCPIYGVGCVLIILLLSKYQSHFFGLFVLAVVLCSVLEYATSYIMEKLFKARWWDYSGYRFNINGWICLETMIPFGIFDCLIIYVVNPFLVEQLGKLPDLFLLIMSIILAVIFIVDVITSFNIVNNFKNTVKSASIADRTEDINSYVKNILLKRSFLYRRLFNAFPRIETKKRGY